jgi:NitT/TauT family transport system substrate-binding protein
MMKIWTARIAHPIKKISLPLLYGLFLLTLLLASCTAPNPSPARPAEQVVEIRIAVLPIIDALPFYVAAKQGYFEVNGVKVTFLPAASAAERDQLITAGQADAMINDLVSVALYNKQTVQVQTVRFARTASKEITMYRVLAAKNSGITQTADLAGVPIGMSQGTVIDYVTTRLLEKEGLSAEQIQSIAVPKLNERLALLGSGQLKAATLPEPFGTIAQQSGAVVLVDDSKYPEYGYSVISLRKAFIDQHPQAVSGFLKALEQAVSDINKTPEQWRPLLGENSLVPEALQATYPMPAFPAASVPSEAQFKDVIDWATARKMIVTSPDYAGSVTAKFLPK